MLRARLDVADIKQSPEPVLFSEQDGEELSGADNQTQVSKKHDESFCCVCINTRKGLQKTMR